jgi:hypothetical protein
MARKVEVVQGATLVLVDRVVMTRSNRLRLVLEAAAVAVAITAQITVLVVEELAS